MSTNSGNGNKSSSGSQMSGADTDYGELRRAARRFRERPANSPVAFGGYCPGDYLGEENTGILAPWLQFEGTPIPSPRPGTGSQQGSSPHVRTPQGKSHIPTLVSGYRSQQGSPSHVGTPQGASQQVSPAYLAPSQNTGRQHTQSPQAGISTRSAGSPGAQAIDYSYSNPSSPSQYYQNAPYAGFGASEQSGTPD